MKLNLDQALTLADDFARLKAVLPQSKLKPIRHRLPRRRFRG